MTIKIKIEFGSVTSDNGTLGSALWSIMHSANKRNILNRALMRKERDPALIGTRLLCRCSFEISKDQLNKQGGLGFQTLPLSVIDWSYFLPLRISA